MDFKELEGKQLSIRYGYCSFQGECVEVDSNTAMVGLKKSDGKMVHISFTKCDVIEVV